jgi:hypothetical protein
MSGKIPAVIEHWDEKLNSWLPNTTSKNWYEKLLIPTINNDTLNEILNGKFNASDKLIQNYYTVEYFKIDEIKNNNYLYIVNIYTPDYFLVNNIYGFKNVSKKILDDVKKNKCKIVFIQDTEGMSGVPQTGFEFDFKMIHDWCENDNIPTNNVYYICGNINSKEMSIKQGSKINAIPITVQDIWVDVMKFPSGPVEFKPVNNKYLYLSYNRRPRYHRVYTAALLLKENILHSGTFSFNTVGTSIPYFDFRNDTDNLIEYVVDVYNSSPFFIDGKDNSGDEIPLYMSLKDYEETFISIVTETLTEPGALFNSEKIWKPLIVGHPFYLIGGKGQIKYLKSLGFKTFDKWIDESYDDLDDVEDRIKLIVNDLKRFKSMSIEDLKTIRDEMRPICEYNKQLMVERTIKRYYIDNNCYHNKVTADELIKIYKTFEPKKII